MNELRPFPFLRHGASAARGLHAWVAFSAPDVDAAQLATRFGRAITRAQGPVLEVRARSMAVRTFEAILRAVHVTAPIGFVVRTNRLKEGSAWHEASIANVSGILGVLERLVRARTGPYLSDARTTRLGGFDDVGRLLAKELKGRAPLAELLAATLEVVSAHSRGEARLVLEDQLVERLPSLLGFDFEVDVVVREQLAQAQRVSPSSVVMPAQFAEAVAARLRAAHQAADLRSTGPIAWERLVDVRRALAGGELRKLAGSLREENEAHVKTLLALEPAELRALVANDQLALRVANAAALLLPVARFADALKLYDAAVEGALPPLACANPLYAVQDDNHHLGIDEARARRYLDRCLPHGTQNPTVFLNASFVLMELGEHDEAVRVLQQAKAGGIAVKHHKNERLFAPLRSRTDFKALMR